MAVDQGDIYWVTLTGAGSEQSGRRPCIVMSRLSVNNAGNTVVVVPLSTSGNPNPHYRIRLPAGEILRDPACKSVIVDSIAKCDHVRVLDKSLLESRIGKLTATAVISVELGLAFVFDIR